MKSFILLSIGLMPLLPASVHAQSIKMADLVGTWVGGSTDSTGKQVMANDTLVVRPDSTYNWAKSTGRLGLTGDSLSFEGRPKYKVTLVKTKGGRAGPFTIPASQQLSLASLGSNKEGYSYTRVETSTPEP